MADEPAPKPPYRTPWEPARRVVRLGHYPSPEALRRELLDLRERVDARQLADLTPEELARTIRDLTEARDRLRRFARPSRIVLAFAATTFAGSGLLLALLKVTDLAWLALGVAIATAAVAALAANWAQHWLDSVAELEGLIADLRKTAQAAPAASPGPGVPSVRKGVMTVELPIRGAGDLAGRSLETIGSDVADLVRRGERVVVDLGGERVELVSQGGRLDVHHNNATVEADYRLLERPEELARALVQIAERKAGGARVRVALDAGQGDTPPDDAAPRTEPRGDATRNRGQR